MRPVFVVDANFFVYRCWFKHLDLDVTIQAACADLLNFGRNGRAVAYVFDGKYGEQPRQKIWPPYKTHRAEKPIEIYIALDAVADELAKRRRVLQVEGVEADDVVATLSRISREAGRETIVVSADKDLMQVIRQGEEGNGCGGVATLHPMKMDEDKALRDFNWFVETYGFYPWLWAHVQALSGDKSDNIPGVPGIGDKGALKLVAQFGPIEEVFAHAEEAGTRYSKLLLDPKARELADLSLSLTTLDFHVNLQPCEA